jgi:serine/threonine-protein kinase
MTTTPRDPDNHNRQLDDLLTAYFQAVEAGATPRVTDLHLVGPELAAEFNAIVEAHTRMRRAADPLRRVARAARADLPDDAFREPDPTASAGAAVPTRFGPFELVDLLGEGGMGAVYRVRDLRHQTVVALKLLLAGRFARSSDLARFRNEAEIVAELDHPNIVPVLDVGEYDDRPYLSMRLMEGGSLAARLDQFPANPRTAVAVVVPLARAVQHTHERGILHRDLKPGNVLLDADGRPYLTDFGLGKWINRGPDLTAPHAILGTIAWMAPEQAGQNARAITTAADVYGLGAVLYGLLTGGPPFRAPTATETLDQLRDVEPEKPSIRNPKVDRDLETICMKCLQKNPARRYASAADLAADLERWLAGEPILARPAGRIERLTRWCRRRPWTVAAATSVVCLVLAVSAVAWTRYESANRQAHEDALQTERQARKDALDTGTIAATLDETHRALVVGQRPRAEAAFDRARERRDGASEAVGARFAEEFAEIEKVFRLEDIRLKDRTPSAAYSATFREFGIDIENTAPDRSAALIRERTVRSALVAALDAWALRTTDSALRQRLRDVADRADDAPDGFPARLRKAVADGDRPALLRLAQEARANLPGPTPLVSLSVALRTHGSANEALQLLKAGVERHPSDFWLNLELAALLATARPPDLEESRRYLAAAYALSNGNPSVPVYVGNALFDRGEYREAAKAFEQAIRRKADYAEAWNNLGNARTQLRDFPAAIEAFDTAIRHRPGFARAYYNRGIAFDDWGRTAEAIESYRAAVRFKLDSPMAHFNLALDLLYREGKFAEALEALDAGVGAVPVGPERDRWTVLRGEAQRLLDLEPRLSAVLSGETPTSAGEAAQLAQLACWPHKLLYRRAANLYDSACALEVDRLSPLRPDKQGELTRFAAACCAALASGGAGNDAAGLDDALRRQLRDRALQWLRIELNARRQQIKRGPADQAKQARAALRAWPTDDNLKNVCPGAVAALPQPERAEWEKFWKEVEAAGR